MRLRPAVLAAGFAAACSLSNAVVAQEAPAVSETALRAHLAFLADDLMEGRGTGQRGGDLAVHYLETQAALIGLKPLADGTYRQAVKFEGAKLLPGSSVTFEAGGKRISPVIGQGIVFGTGGGNPELSFDAPLVFVGYGVTAPEERWDDYKDQDMKGKILVMMVDDPQPTAEEPDRFEGEAYTYYGRWIYKFEEAVRRGAAGVLLIHTVPSASYAWSVPVNSFAGERFHSIKPGNQIEGWLHEDTARELFAAAGFDLDELRAQAERRDFRPVDLKIGVKVQLRSAIRKIEQFNVIGIVPGSDPKLKEQAVVYSSHWDHMGMAEDKGQPDRIYNGAIDNASGVAALLTMAAEAAKKPARRTQVFLWPAAEEHGLLGSAAYVANPVVPLARTAADLNLDSLNFAGRTRDIGVPGAKRSSLYDAAVQVAGKMGLKVAPTTPDLSGAFFRADHFSFVKAGVPAISVGSPVFSGDGHFEFEHDQQDTSAKMVGFKSHYHQVSDEYHPGWDLSGMVQQAQFTLNLGYVVANAQEMPTWKAGGAFSRIKR